MPKARKYINRNPYPVSLPNGKGGQITFRSGQGTFDQWFSRFVGVGMLTPSDVVVSEREARIHNAPEESPQNYMQVVYDTIKDEDEPDYTRKNGIYTCKHCGIFKTGSSTSLYEHINRVHKKTIKPVTEDAEEQVSLTSRRSMSSTALDNQRKKEEPVLEEEPEFIRNAKSGASEVTEVAETAEEEPKEDVVQEEFRCSVAGCGKVFKSQQGLRMHTSKVHKEQ